MQEDKIFKSFMKIMYERRILIGLSFVKGGGGGEEIKSNAAG